MTQMTPLPESVTHYIHGVMPAMHGWCSPAKAEMLARTVLDSRPRICVEIGVFAGRSMFAVATALKHLAEGTILGIDPWSTTDGAEGYDGENRDWWNKLDHSKIFQQCIQIRSELGVAPYVELFVGRSDQAISMLNLIKHRFTDGQPFIDLLHIDGNHSEERALYDAKNYVPLMTPRGILFFDDLGWKTTKPAQEHIASLCEMINEVDGCGVFRRNR